MSRSGDRDLGMHRDINRRDFINGVGVAIGGSLIAPGWLSAREGTPYPSLGQEYYPPALTGMRGSHPGSFEAGHALRDGNSWSDVTDTRESYDMVVVGGGLSGLSAAYFFLTSAGRGARVLVLDNHDDFGGHAKRNEMTYRGRTLMLPGGTSYLESVGHYSAVCRTLLAAIGIDIDSATATSAAGRRFYGSLGLGSATFFGKEVFGEDRLVMGRGGQSGGWADWLAQTPMSAEAQRDIARLYDDGANPDYMPGLSDADKKDRLARMSYRDFLLDLVKAHPDVIPFFNDRPKGSFCVGIDGHPALYGWVQGYPGFQGMNLEPLSPVGPLAHIGGGQHGREDEFDDKPDIHFPDGNATVARLLVRAMIPDALPGTSLGDSMTSRLRYDRIDREGSDARIRLNSMAVSVRHLGDPDAAREVEITYVRGGKAEKVRAAHVVMGCYNGIIPHLCPEMSDEQKVALKYGVKMPLVSTNVLTRDWTAFKKLGISRVTAPGMYHSGVSLGRSIPFGDYEPSRSADDPMILHMSRTPCAPGHPKKEQHRIGREDLLATTFETFERNIRDQLGRMLEGGGFDPARDIEAITVNRWPHGYAYSYNTLDDPIEWALFTPDDRPCVVGSRRFGRISIANSDAAASTHTDSAIDEAHRAAREQLLVRSLARRRASSTDETLSQ